MHRTSELIVSCSSYLASVSRKSRVVTVDFPHPAQKEVRRSLKVFPNIEYLAADVIPAVQDMLDGGDIPQFIHIAHTSLWRQIVEMVLPYATPDMVIVVDDLGKKPKKEWWNEIIKDERIGVTFQMKKAGLLFFDPKMTKQHYVL